MGQFSVEKPALTGQFSVEINTLLAPHSWQPITLQRFSQALYAGEGWRDHPVIFFDESRAQNINRFILDIDDIAEDKQPRTTIEKEKRTNQLEYIREIVCNILGNQILVAADNVIYRKFAKIKLRIILDNGSHGSNSETAFFAGPKEFILAWECGGLRSWADPNPLSYKRVVDLIDCGACPVALYHILEQVVAGLNASAGMHCNSKIYKVPKLIEINTGNNAFTINYHNGNDCNPASLVDLESIADLFMDAICGMKFIRSDVAQCAQELSSNFKVACNLENFSGAECIITQMSNTVFLAANSSKIETYGRTFDSSEDNRGAYRAVAALILTEATLGAISVLRQVSLEKQEDDWMLEDLFREK